jgi:hypothetical protein
LRLMDAELKLESLCWCKGFGIQQLQFRWLPDYGETAQFRGRLQWTAASCGTAAIHIGHTFSRRLEYIRVGSSLAFLNPIPHPLTFLVTDYLVFLDSWNSNAGLTYFKSTSIYRRGRERELMHAAMKGWLNTKDRLGDRQIKPGFSPKILCLRQGQSPIFMGMDGWV